MACSAAAAWTLPAALAITLASAWPASAETTAAAMTAFGLTGTWSDDCTKDPAKEGARLTYSPPGTRTPSYRFVLFDKDGNKITVSSDILPAARLPQGKLKTVTVKTGINGNATGALQPLGTRSGRNHHRQSRPEDAECAEPAGQWRPAVHRRRPDR